MKWKINKQLLRQIKSKSDSIKKVGETLNGLKEEQKMKAFLNAWSGAGLPKILAQRCPEHIYQRIFKNLEDLLEQVEKQKYEKKTLEQFEKDILNNAYNYSDFAAATKHLTPEQVEEYSLMSSKINEFLVEAEKYVYLHKHKVLLNNILLDQKKEYDREKTKMMKEFGLN